MQTAGYAPESFVFYNEARDPEFPKAGRRVWKGFSGDDAGRMLQELFAGQYTAEEFAEAYEQAWQDGMNTGGE